MQGSRSIGALTIALPLTAETESKVLERLLDLGWDGRVWPYDNDGKWPEGTPDKDQSIGLLQRVGLASTMTFAPVEGKGFPTIPVYVVKKKGEFPFPFEPSVKTEDMPHRNRLRDLMVGWQVFQPMKPVEVNVPPAPKATGGTRAALIKSLP